MNTNYMTDPGWYPTPALKEAAAKKVEEHYKSKGYKTQMRQEDNGRWTVLYRKG